MKMEMKTKKCTIILQCTNYWKYPLKWKNIDIILPAIHNHVDTNFKVTSFVTGISFLGITFGSLSIICIHGFKIIDTDITLLNFHFSLSIDTTRKRNNQEVKTNG